ncbi:hypothetical protein NCS52_00278800 [Fusarium sp. LHS14.1]|nr:hypothetical protein NCS52_00278800 [Fusarium sp. LHS14.1]
MAEVVGLITGVAGLTPIIASVVGGIRRLREIRRDSTDIPEGLDCLIKYLSFLQLIIENADAILRGPGADYCQGSIAAVAKGIEELLDKFPLNSISSGKKPNLKETWGLRHWKEEIKVLRETVEKAKQDLVLYLGIMQVMQLNFLSRMIQTEQPEITASCDASSSFGSVTESEGLSSSSLVKYTPARRVVRQDCAITACYCSCHRVSRISRRFWALDYTGLFPNNKCDQPSCTASAYGFRLRVALSQLGIPWSVTMGLHFLAGIGRFNIQPALQVERVVKYTSPGFEIIWRLKHGLIKVDEACIAFRLLAREDPTLKLHVDPSGSSATPLMYAVGYDEIDAAKILIRAGADPFVRGGSGFANLLIARANWDFMMRFFRFLDDEAMQITAERLAEEIVFLLVFGPFSLGGLDYLPQLLSRCKSLNSPLELPRAATHWQVVRGRTLFHYARSAKEVDALLGLGFSMINQVDQEGQHALMSVINRADRFDSETLVKRLLDAGADINLQDRREWIILVLETCGTETAKQALLAIIRRTEHERLGMTHTCCGRKGYPSNISIPKPMPEDDVEDILEEEVDFIRILDEKMEHESKRDINSLLRRVILDTKPPISEAFQSCPSSETFGPRDIQDLKGYRVDHKNDCFVTEVDPRHVPKYTLDEIARYALWLEKRLQKSNISEQTAINPWRDGYFRRISWLQFICNAMEISTKRIAEQFRHRATSNYCSLNEKEKISEDAQHFFQSWEEWSTKGPAVVVDSTDGFADWPLEEASD